MAASRRSPPADDAAAQSAVESAVARALDDAVERHAPVAVALSGGRDSVALLAAAAQVRQNVLAVHVHHGLSRHADAWAAFCAELASSLRVPFVLRRVSVDARDPRGVEEAARIVRHDALREAAREHDAAAILVAHHQDDQAETLLLQLGRGAGPAGLAGMARVRRDASGALWLRPLLDLPRRALEAYVRARGLRYVEDDSNTSAKHRRNALRRDVIPALAATFPGYPATFARAAAHQAEASRLADDIADIDLESLLADGTIDRRGLAALPAHRARNVLRRFLRLRGLRAPALARLSAMHAQLVAAREDANIALNHEAVVIGVFRDRIVVHAPPPAPFERRWQGDDEIALPHGRLRFMATNDDGLARERLERADVVVRSRLGGERMQLASNRPRRALKSLLQEAAIPPWERASLPLVFCDGELAAVPGIGVDVRYAAPRGMPALRVDWQPSR